MFSEAPSQKLFQKLFHFFFKPQEKRKRVNFVAQEPRIKMQDRKETKLTEQTIRDGRSGI